MRRYEFLLGKYLGSLLILGVIVAILTVVLVGVLLLQQHMMAAQAVADQADSRFDASIPSVVFAAIMSYFSLAVLTALILLVSSVASTTMTVLCSILLWGVGMMQSMLFELMGKMTGAMHFLIWLFYHAVPPLQDFDLRQNVANLEPISVTAALQTLEKGALYAIVALLFAALFFENRQV